MKKSLIIAVMALAVCLASCGKKPEIVLSNVTYAPTVVTPADQVTVNALATCNEAFTVTLCYKVNSSEAQEVEMKVTETPNQYVATIPAQELDAVVEFYVYAAANDFDVMMNSEKYTYTVVTGAGGGGGGDYSTIVLNELNGGSKFIEIYNTGDAEVNLEGVYMIKDERQDTNWLADATVVVPAHGWLLLYSEDVVIEGEAQEGYPENLVFHSGFSAKKAVKIELFTPAGESIDAFVRCPEGGTWGDGMTNVGSSSFARVPDGGEWKLVDTATPGEANPTEGNEIPE